MAPDRTRNSLHSADDEYLRQQDLLRLGVLDSDSDDTFDRIVRLAKHIFDVPVALLSFVDTDRQWFLARQGMAERQTPRAWSFCDHALGSNYVMEILDPVTDPRFAENPLVTRDEGIRYYAGAPLISDHANIGTLCIIDTKSRTPLSKTQRTVLSDLAMLTMDHLRIKSSLSIELS